MNKIIDWRIFDPANSIFKSSKNERATFRKTICNNAENYQAYKNGGCTALEHECPYSKIDFKTGYTQRAAKHFKWISEARESVKGIPQLNLYKKIAKVGDYIFFPYRHWYTDTKITTSEITKDTYRYAGGFSHPFPFIKKSDFTIDLFNNILNADPRTLFGNERITRYAKEIVPIIVQHTKEEMPEFWEEFAVKYPDVANKYQELDCIGRRAYVKTLKKGCSFKTKKELFHWDGKQMTIKNYDGIFLPIDGEATLIVVPNDDAIIEIVDNCMVDSNTKFKD